MSDSRVRSHVVVEGRVQGVYFRGSTQEEARRRDVDGWVRNRPDGAVEAVFEGAADAVAALVQFCREGPGLAAVERIEAWQETPEGLDGFEIRI